jgi:ABC-2 type transport system permease protein
MRYIKLWLTFLKFSLKEVAAYRVDFFFRVFSMFLMMVIMYLVLSLPFEHTESIAGWSRREALFLISVYYMSNGLSWTLFRKGISDLERLVRSGDFDSRLIKPVDSAFLVSFFHVDIARLGDFIMGGFFAVWTLLQAGWDIKLVNIVAALSSFLAGLWIVTRIFLMVNSLSFWVTETYLDHVANPLLVVAKYPVDIWTEAFQKLLYWFLPIAFVSTVPTAILIGKLDAWWALPGILLAGCWTFAARTFWNFALKHYSSTGS